MKRLLALLSTAVTIGAAAQTMPYNPDANSDGFIGSSDLLTFLPLYDTQVGLTDSVQTCNYDGTDFENWVIGVLDMSIVIDSIRISYLIEDSSVTYSVGCPDGVYEYVTLERSYLLTVDYTADYNQYGVQVRVEGELYGWPRVFVLYFSESSNGYNMIIFDNELSHNPIVAADPYDEWFLLPFDDVATLDSTGLHINFQDGTGAWPALCSYFSLLPYWHYAD